MEIWRATFCTSSCAWAPPGELRAATFAVADVVDGDAVDGAVVVAAADADADVVIVIAGRTCLG